MFARLPFFDPEHQRVRMGEGLDMTTELVFSLAALLGDSMTSFVKWRLGLVLGGSSRSPECLKACFRSSWCNTGLIFPCRVSLAS